MPIFFTSPTFARPGVVAGFTLVAPLADTPASGPIGFVFYNANTTVNGQALTIATGFTHWVQVGNLTYSYVQRDGDTPNSIATALAALMNSTPDPNAVANASGSNLMLAPREDTDAPVICYASEAYQSEGVLQVQELVELTGNSLIPTLTRGVLFAQGTMYRPAQNPVLPAAPASRGSWLFYSSTGGFYWQANATPTASDDALIGWAVTNAAQIVAFSSRRIGNGEEAVVQAPLSALLIEGTSGDTGAPPMPIYTFGVGVMGTANGYMGDNPGHFVVGNIGFESAENTAGITSATFLIFFIDELQPAIGTLTAALAATDTQMSVSAALPTGGPALAVFTFQNSGVVGGITIGPGYVHNITIGAAIYQYTQQTGDSAATVAAQLAQVVNALNDPNATATAKDATVTLSPLRDDGTTVICSASDGNGPWTLTEQMPTYVLVEDAGGGHCELIELFGVNGARIVRGAFPPFLATAFAIGARVWAVEEETLYFTLPDAAYGTPGWPSNPGTMPFRGKGLVAINAWVTNEYGKSPVSSMPYATGGGRISAYSMIQISMSVQGVLAIGSNVAGRCLGAGLALNVMSIAASVESAPVGAPIACTINVDGSAWLSFTIPTTITPGQVTALVTMLTTPGVDGLVMPANPTLTLDITAVGTTNPGSGLLVVVNC